MTFEHDDTLESGVSIRVIGVGGGGNNAVNRMISTNIRGVDFIAINTDRQAIRRSDAPTQLVIGEKITKGFGAGANPAIGARAAEESIEDIKQALTGADMVFVTAGMGKRRMDQAMEGISELSQYVDSLVIIPNERLKQVSDTRITLANAFEIADDVLRRGVQSISELINVPSFINLDFADVTSVMADAGYAHMGVGSASGKDKAEQAAKAAISSPLLETTMNGATGILISITASNDVGLEDIDLASTLIANEASPNANVIWGVAFDNDLDDEMRITIIATGFNKKPDDDTRTVTVTAEQNVPKTAEQASPVQQAKVEPAPVSKAAERPKATSGRGSDISESDLDDIMSIFRKK